MLHVILCMHRTIRCSRDVPERGWREREVTFSWSPLPVTQHCGYLTNYTLSCSPSPSSLPQSPSQSGPLTVTGFSPDTSYSCSVVANNGLGSGPPSTTTFTTLPDCMYMGLWYICLLEVDEVYTVCFIPTDVTFQLRFKEILSSCPEFLV